MIQFNKLSVTPDGKCLVLDASMVNDPLFEHRYITEIFIDSDVTFVSKDIPSDKAYHMWIEGTDTRSIDKTFSAAELASVLKGTDTDLRNHIFFVYVCIDGVVSGMAPCGADESTYIGVAVNWGNLFYRSLDFMKAMKTDCCNIPKRFIDYILRLNALELSIKTGHYENALYFWKKFFSKNKRHSVSTCGCNK